VSRGRQSYSGETRWTAMRKALKPRFIYRDRIPTVVMIGDHCPRAWCAPQIGVPGNASARPVGVHLRPQGKDWKIEHVCRVPYARSLRASPYPARRPEAHDVQKWKNHDRRDNDPPKPPALTKQRDWPASLPCWLVHVGIVARPKRGWKAACAVSSDPSEAFGRG
jgi:hypothetical protein